MTLDKRQWVGLSVAALGVVALSVVSLAALREPYHGYVWTSSFTNGWYRVLPITAASALKVGAFWSLASAIIALILLRIDPELEIFDALIGGAAGTWIFAYIAGNLLGPLGLFRSSTIWLMIIAAIAYLWRHPPKIEIHTPSTGQTLALLACALIIVGMLPLQLGSPLPPYMDVLNTPASAQRILTFGRYLPFDNDPYGYWTPFIQTPGVELFYAMLGFGSFTDTATLAEMGALVPMCCLIIMGAYRLGRTLMNDAAGGFAALLLFATTMFQRAHSMRGTAVSFALVAIGLAFFLDRNQRLLRTAVGALALGTAIASHAIVGGLALATAGSTLLIRLPRERVKDLLAEALYLFGIVLVAVPEFAVAMTIRLPYPALPLSQLAGVFLIWRAARLNPRFTDDNIFAVWTAKGLVLLLLLLLLWRPDSLLMLHGLFGSLPILFVACVIGLTALILLKLEWPVGAYVIAASLLIGIAAEYTMLFSHTWLQGTGSSFGIGDVINKVGEYWYPYFLIFPAAAAFDLVYHRGSKVVSIAALLALMIYPFFQRPDLDPDPMYTEHSLAQEWAVDLLIAKQGWWGNTEDTRWAQSPAELSLDRLLREEVQKGRITTATHIVHVTPHTIMWRDVLLFSVYTGIDDDLYIVHPDPTLGEGSTSSSRLRPVSMLPDAIARNPAYIVVHQQPPAWLSLPPAGYDEIFDQGDLRLFRRRDFTHHVAASTLR